MYKSSIAAISMSFSQLFLYHLIASQKRLGHKILGFFTHRNKCALVCTFSLCQLKHYGISNSWNFYTEACFITTSMTKSMKTLTYVFNLLDIFHLKILIPKYLQLNLLPPYLNLNFFLCATERIPNYPDSKIGILLAPKKWALVITDLLRTYLLAYEWN